MTTFEKLSLKSLLSHIPEILNSNFSSLKTLIEKFYIDESDTVTSHDMDVEGILQIGEDLKTNNVYVRYNGSTISLYDILERIKNLENKENNSGGNDDPGNDPGDDPINPPIDPVDPVDPSSGGEPIWVPDDFDPTSVHPHCVALAQYYNLLQEARNGVKAYGYTNDAKADEMLTKYCRHIKYNNYNARPGSDSWDEVYGTLDDEFLIYMQTNYSTFTEVEVVYLSDGMYLDIIHFWAVVNGLMCDTGDLAGWGSDLLQLAVEIDMGANVTSLPSQGFTELDLISDFEAIRFYNEYTNGNNNIDRAFRESFVHYLNDNEYANYDIAEYRRVKTFTDLRGTTDVETLYENSDSSTLLNEWLVDQFNISSSALSTAKTLFQQYINKALSNDNTVSVGYFIRNAVGKVETQAKSYKQSSGSEQDSNTIFMQYYRSINYHDVYWNNLYGTADSNFKTYIENMYPYFKTIKYVRTRNGSLVDFIHLFAALEALFNTFKDLGGWAGDLVEYAQYIPTHNAQGEFPGMGFEHEDFCADFDAVSIYKNYLTFGQIKSLPEIIEDVYNVLQNSPGQRAEDIVRVNDFISYKGSGDVAQIYASSESAVPLSVLKIQRQVTDENLNTAIGILQTHINNLIS